MPTFASDGSQSDVQSKIDGASDGDTVTIPSGSFSWTSEITISGKAIHLQGAGAGRVVARSLSSVAVGTGTKTFTVNDSGLDISNGQTLQIRRLGNAPDGTLDTDEWVPTWMIGTVNSYSGTTLEMNITSVESSGTHAQWIIISEAATTIDFANNVEGGSAINLVADTTGHVRLSGIRFTWGAGAGERYMIIVTGTRTSNFPPLIYDCYFEIDGGAGHETLLWEGGHRGLIWDCSFVSWPFGRAGTFLKVAEHADTGDWTSASTMGAADSTGLNNLYVEDCDFHAIINATDFDGNSRAVVRYSLFNNAGAGSHGADSGLYGVRHVEIYNNVFTFQDLGEDTMPLTWWYFCRGGTGVFTDNTADNITSSWWGPKPEIVFAVLQLQESWGPNPDWGAGIVGIQYPCPRQPGMGYIDGTGLDGLGRNEDSVTFVGDSEPIYIWNNTGTFAAGFADGTDPQAGADETADYVVEDRDYFIDGTAKPGYTKFEYPHPLREEDAGGDGVQLIGTLTVANLVIG